MDISVTRGSPRGPAVSGEALRVVDISLYTAACSYVRRGHSEDNRVAGLSTHGPSDGPGVSLAIISSGSEQ